MPLFPSTAVLSQANTGGEGGTIYWAQVGQLKMMWGISADQTVNTNKTYTFTLPTFFTTVQVPVQGNVSANNINYSFVVNFSTSQVQVQIQSTASITAKATFFMLGT